MEFKEYITHSGEIILFNGNPNFQKLEELSKGAGDIWHSSFEQGYKNAFPEIVYQTAVFFWYVNDFDNLDECVSWRVNPNAFAVRKTVWETLKGFDLDFSNLQLQGLDFGYNALRVSFAVPMYVKGLFISELVEKITITAKDRYVFFKKNFKIEHSIFMIYRMGFWKLKEWQSFLYARKNFKANAEKPILKPRELKLLEGSPTTSYIIPTMMRQDFTLQLLKDLASQTHKIDQVVVVDATPADQRDENVYEQKKYPFELIIKWQETKGSCKARNEAISLCTGEYVFFGDDDIRIDTNFIENHLRFLQTYNAVGCNGLDILADNFKQDLADLRRKLIVFESKRWKVGATSNFSNANSCVKRQFVNILVGNDVNFDGGYGEDADFGFSLAKLGKVVLSNPFSVNLHLKPPSGGYRWWGNQAKILGKKRKIQPWELDSPVKFVRPVPSPTIMYGIIKHFTTQQLEEYRQKYFFLYLFKGKKSTFMLRMLNVPYKLIQFKKSVFYAQKLINLGSRFK